jgi:hypothetical protein
VHTFHARFLLALGLGLSAALGVACGSGEGTEPSALSSWTVDVQPLETPAGPGSIAPQLTSSASGVILSWVERTGEQATLAFAERAGGAWSPRQTAASGTGWFLSWADVPSVLRLSTGTLVSSWFVTTREEIEAYDTYLSYSTNNGQTWAPAFTPHHDKTTTQHGFASLMEMPDTGLGLVWLDGRDMHNNTTHPEGGVMTLRFTSFDPAWTQGPDMEINARVCECCQTAAVVTSDGMLAAFRDRSESDIRDIAVSRLENGRWSDAAIVHDDGWEIYLCPVNGPALSARGNDVAVAWFTMQDDEGHAFAAFSGDGGRSWSAPIRLDEQQSLGYVDVELLDDGTAVASWVEFANGRRQLKMRRVDSSGGASATVEIAGSGEGRVGGYPRMARQGDELIFAWTESTAAADGTDTVQYVQGAVARIPRTTAP